MNVEKVLTEIEMSGAGFDHPPSATRDKVFICTSQRSGSFLLCRAMIHRGLGFPHEYFNNVHSALIGPRVGISRLSNGHLIGDDPEVRRSYIEALLDRRTVNGIFAAKIQWWEYERYLNNSEGHELLQGGRFIHLYRKDLLAQAVSFHFSSETGRWGNDDLVTTAVPATPRFFDDGLLSARLAELAFADMNWRLFFTRNGITPLEITYESLVTDVASVLRKIVDAYDVRVPPVDTDYVEPAPKSLTAANEPTKSELKAWYMESHQVVTQGEARRSLPSSHLTDQRVAVFCCGVQKGGTTSLFRYLREHPALSTPQFKELHFFDDETQDWDAPDYAELEAYFRGDDTGLLRFEATPIYSFWPSSIERIRDYNPGAKLIYLFRDPFQRAWSHWRMEYGRGSESLSFADAIRVGRRRLDGLPSNADDRRVYTYIERGLYSEQVRRALANFSREQLLFLRSQDLLEDPVTTLTRIAGFLGVEAFPESAPKRAFRQPSEVEGFAPPTEDDCRYVADIVRSDIWEFASLTGLDVSDWPTMTLEPGVH